MFASPPFLVPVIRGLRYLYGFCFLAFVASGTGCTDPAPVSRGAPQEYLVDDLERNVSIRLPVRRVVSLAPSVTEILFASGGLAALVGVTTADDYPAVVKTLPSYSALPVNFEAIISLKPDLVLATTQVNNQRDAAVLEQLGVSTFFLRTRSIEDVIRNIRTLGTILGTEQQAEQAADSLQNELRLLHNATDTLSSRPSVLVLISEKKLFSFGSKSYVNDLISLAGGTSITAGLHIDAPMLSEEFVIIERPEAIFGSFPDGVGAVELLSYHPEWAGVPAISNGDVYSVSPDLLLRAGPRTIEISWQMLAILHPELVLKR